MCTFADAFTQILATIAGMAEVQAIVLFKPAYDYAMECIKIPPVQATEPINGALDVLILIG